MRRVAITTEDNPFDPFDQFDLWFHFDETKGYHSSGLLGRVAAYTDELSESDELRILEEAIDSLVAINPTGNLRKLVRS